MGTAIFRNLTRIRERGKLDVPLRFEPSRKTDRQADAPLQVPAEEVSRPQSRRLVSARAALAAGAAMARGRRFGPRTRAAALVGVVAAALAPFHAADRASVLSASASPGSEAAKSVIGAFKDRHGVTIVMASAKSLFKDFRRIGYRLEDVRAGAGAVPRVFVKAIPEDIRHVRSIPTRKAVFIKTLLPLVLRANEELLAVRARATALVGTHGLGLGMAPHERAWLAAQYDRFGVTRGDVETLLRRIDIIPPSLAIAQGAEESGWGTSRFAIEGRALFGQRTYREAPGLVPAGRDEGERFKVRRFDQLLDAVRAYVHNLNTHPAYRGFRELRARLRSGSGGASELDALRLIEALEAYSARGRDYVKTIKTIIRANDLQAFDGARLSRTLEDALALSPSA